jgi:hypothetical protein
MNKTEIATISKGFQVSQLSTFGTKFQLTEMRQIDLKIPLRFLSLKPNLKHLTCFQFYITFWLGFAIKNLVKN